MACPLLSVSENPVRGRAGDAAAGGNAREEAVEAVAAGENVPALTSEGAKALVADDEKALVLAGGVPAYDV